MELATWIGAVATAIYAVFFVGTAIFVVFQLKEMKLQRDANVMKTVYDYVIATHDDRGLIYSNADAIRAVRTQEDLWLFEAAQPAVDKAIHNVSNCYHYVGFLLAKGMLSGTAGVVDEGGHTVVRIDDIIGTYVRIRRQAMGQPDYKQYYDYLVAKAKTITAHAE